MKKTFTILTAALMLLAMFASPMRVLGQTTSTANASKVTSSSFTWTSTDNNVTWSGTVNGGATNQNMNSGYAQIGTSSSPSTSVTLSTSSVSGTITSIVINCAAYQGKATVSATVGGSAFGTQSQSVPSWSSNSGGNVTFSGSATGSVTVTMTNGSGGRAMYIKSISVTYTTGGGTTYTVTYDCNDGTSGCPENVSNISPNTSINLASAPSKTGYTFGGWNDGTQTYAASASYTVTSDVTFTAQWTVNTHSITMPSDNTYGSYSRTPNDAAVAYGTEVTLTYTPAQGYENYVATWTVNNQAISSNTFTMPDENVTVGVSVAEYQQPTEIEIIPNYTFWGKDAQFSGNDFSELEGEQDNVTLNWTKGTGSTYANQNAMRFYKDNTLTFAAPTGYEIKSIVLTVTGTYSDLSFSPTGFDSENTTWSGSSTTVTMTRPSNASSYATISKFTITIGLTSSDPSITADDVELAYNATSGEIVYSITNPATGVNLSATSNAAWITNVTVDGTNSKVTFSTSANPNTTQRTGTITLSYTGATDKIVTITQAGAPVIFSTIPDIFNAATSTSTDVNVTFGNWVVSGVSGSNAFVTDNNGNGFIIYKSGHGFAVNNKLSGTVMETPLKLYKGSAEFTDLTTATEGLTVSNDGTITVITNKTIADLSGVNTGSVITLSNLSYDGTDLSDGTNNIKPYSTLYSDMSFTSGKTYNVTGVYQQFDNTKEILPRSADDIVEVVVTVPTIIIASSTVNATAASASGTITVEYENFSTINASVWFCNAAGTTETSYNWLTATINASNNVDYTIQSNSSEARTAYFKVKSGDTYSNIVTINQAEYVDPNTGTITFGNSTGSTNINATSVTGSDSKGNTWTITTVFGGDESFTPQPGYSQVGSSKKPATSITFTTTLPQSVTITAFSAMFGGFGDTAGDITLNVGETSVGSGSLNGTNDVTVTNSSTAAGTVLTVTVTNIAKGVKCYSISYTYETTPTPQTFTLDIDQYTSGQNNGWYLIASPVAVDLASNTMVSGTYDLYRFNPNAAKEWENYKASHSDFTTLEVGRGYLYANGNDNGIQLSFTGVPANNGEVTAAYTGWNLVGNPLSTAATVDGDYYRMNDTHDGIMTTISSSNTSVAVMEGIFVQTTQVSETVTFTAAASKGVRSNDTESVTLNVMRNNNVIDRAIVRFNSDRQLGKLTLFDGDTKIYIPQNDGDYAIVSSNGKGTMPVNFKAKEMGMYTISVETEGIDLSYLHLIDRLTGEDINLLRDSKYSFIASSSDTESRFILSFDENGINANNDTFAFQNGNDIIVNGEGELQIFDVMGRNIMNTMINGVQTVNVKSNGVYIFKLNEKTQKIIVR